MAHRWLVVVLVLLSVLCCADGTLVHEGGVATSMHGGRLRAGAPLKCGSSKVMQRGLAFLSLPIVEVLPRRAAERTLSAAADEAEYRNIRIGVFTPDLEDSSRYCTKAGQTRPNFEGGNATCSSEDVLSEEKRNVLLNQLLPAAIKLHEDRLKVQSVRGSVVVPKFNSPSYPHIEEACSFFSIPATHHEGGVDEVDFILYFAAGPTNAGVAAWAGHCAELGDGRPVVGVGNISPAFIEFDEFTVRLLAHEIAHALGFNSITFKKQKVWENATGLRGKWMSPMLVSPKVIEAGKEHFGWSGLTGVELEDQGGSGTAYSHWKRRNLKNELMDGFVGIGYYSNLTLAAFEDLGFYKADYALAEPMTWGYQAGEKFLTEKCVIDGKSQFPSMFCDQISEKLYCTEDRTGLGQCSLNEGSFPLPYEVQYFSDPRWGGSSSLMDFCPSIDEIMQETSCLNGDPILVRGSIIGSRSRCLESTADGLKYSGETLYGVCAEFQCDKASQTFQIKLLGQKGFTPCPEGHHLDASRLSSRFKSGHVVCPSYMSVCSINIREGTAKKRSAFNFDIYWQLGLVIGLSVAVAVGVFGIA